MLNIEGLNKLLKSLNLQIKKTKNGVFYLNNYNDDTNHIIQKKDNRYHYLFEKDGIIYHLSFNEDSFRLTTGLGESITIDSNSFEYYKRINDSDRNEALVTINPVVISFYQQKSLPATTEEYYSISTKAQTARNLFLFYKKAETIGQDGTLKKDSTISYDEDNAIKADYIRYYNEDGKLIKSDEDEITIGEDMDEYVIADLASQDHIKELLERINSILPDIDQGLVNTNPNLHPIIELIKANTKKKQ